MLSDSKVLLLLMLCGIMTGATALEVPVANLDEVTPIIAHNVEDMVVVNLNWTVGSGKATPGSGTNYGHLHLFNTYKKTVKDVLPELKANPNDKGIFPGCPSPPNFTETEPHGLDYYEAEQRLYMISHGARESTEVFNVTTEGEAEPNLAWIGCVLSLKSNHFNAVVGLEHNNILMTSTKDPNDPNASEKIFYDRAPSGNIYLWNSSRNGGEFESLLYADPNMSSPNGLLASRDGSRMFSSLSGNQQVIRLDRSPTTNRYSLTGSSPVLGFDLDNIRWTPDESSIFVGGQAPTSIATEISCTDQDINCSNDYAGVMLIDPDTLQVVTTIIPGGLNLDGFRAGTGAVRVKDELWCTSTMCKEIIVVPVHDESISNTSSSKS